MYVNIPVPGDSRGQKRLSKSPGTGVMEVCELSCGC